MSQGGWGGAPPGWGPPGGAPPGGGPPGGWGGGPAGGGPPGPPPPGGFTPPPGPIGGYATGLPPGTSMPHGGLSTGGGGSGGQNDPLAIVALALGLFGFVFNCCCGPVSIVMGIAAVIFGIVSLANIGKEPHRFSTSSKPMAIVGIVLGALGALGQVGMLAFSFTLPFAFGP